MESQVSTAVPVLSPVSALWLRQQAQQESRVEYHGPTITWPIRKLGAPLTDRSETKT